MAKLAKGTPGRRIAHLQRGTGSATEDWYIDLQDTDDEAHAHARVHTSPDPANLPPLIEQNGGGWALVAWLPQLPHEAAPDA